MAIHGWGIFLIILLVLIVGGAGGYIAYAHYRARRLGLPPPNFNPFSHSANTSSSAYRVPAPAPGGVQGWISDRISALRGGNRTTTGNYESSGYNSGLGGGSNPRGGPGHRGFGALDPDEAWDSRVDHEVYHEDQELGGLGEGGGPYGGGGYGVGIGGIEEGRGRSRSRQRELDARYDEEMHGGRAARSDPFGDHAETRSMDLRSVSPRPEGTYQGHKKTASTLSAPGHEGDSPVERRSLFREDV